MRGYIAAALCGLLAAGTTFGQDEKKQPPGGGRGQGRGGMFGRMGAGASNAQLLDMKEVQEDVKLGDSDKEKVKKLIEELREGDRKAQEELRDASPEERREKMTARRAEVDKLIKETLGDKYARFHQIRLQLDGAFMSVTMNPELRKELDVTDDQLRELREASMAGIERPQQGERPSPEKMAEMREKMQKNQTEAVDKVFSAEQKKKWEEMIGAKVSYKRPVQQGGGCPGGGGRPPGGDAKPPARS